MNALAHTKYFFGVDIPSDDFLTQCMHCGLCLPTCPTFQLTGNEKSSPRGRIRLIKSVAEGKLEFTQGFIDEMNFCLDCQACETACPAGVKYGALVESARNQIRLQNKQGWLEKILKRIFLRNVLSKNTLLKLVAKMLWAYQTIGIEWFIKKTGSAKLITPKLAKLQELSPRVDNDFFDESFPEIIKPRGEIKYRVGFLSGCLMNVSFSKINEDTIKVLLHHDCEVIIPQNQVCCGSLQAHSGDFDIARDLARKNIDVFLQYEFDAIIMNSAGCGAFMKEYEYYLKSDLIYREKAKIISAKIKDISEFLFKIGLKQPERSINKKITYHDACHLVHAQKIFKEPRELIKQIPGVEYIELPEASWCCGSAGIYNIVNYDDSMKILDRKLKNINCVKPEYVIASNPGCLLQIASGLKQNGSNITPIHLSSFLREVYDV